QGLLPAQTVPPACRGFAQVIEVGDIRVTHIEQIPEHRHGLPLLTSSQEIGHGETKEWALQIQQSRFDRGGGVDAHAQIESLVSAPTGVDRSESSMQLGDDPVDLGHTSTGEFTTGLFDRSLDVLTTGHLP